uniref:Uncharacterized protein n=1 Tax=uncultured alpha proteobacterium HF0130_06E21 TaxID=710808 RepID=E0XT07_9PROT|nr:hypothetical protein [uncultured alpha proteobacterium HF0130_06E21]
MPRSCRSRNFWLPNGTVPPRGHRDISGIRLEAPAIEIGSLTKRNQPARF